MFKRLGGFQIGTCGHLVRYTDDIRGSECIGYRCKLLCSGKYGWTSATARVIKRWQGELADE